MGARSIKDVLARVRHDPLLEQDTVCIEVEHRGAPGDRRQVRCERRSLEIAPAGFAAPGEAFIPYHRVLLVSCGDWVWERSGRGLKSQGGPAPRLPEETSEPMPTRIQELADWGIGMDSATWWKLAEYRGLIERGNRVHNLVSRNLDRAGLDALIVDSLAALPLLGACPGTLMDVGSGAGLPGLPLALALPDPEVVLLEPSLKRAAFLESAIERLGLTRVTVRSVRLEDLGPGRFSVACLRGLPWARHAEALAGQLAPGGLVVSYGALKGGAATAPAGWRCVGALRTARIRVQAWTLPWPYAGPRR